VAHAKVVLVQGDITEQSADAVVNAANSSLLGGGGVDGAIHRKGGPEILEACKAIRNKQGSLPAGRAVITTGGELPAKHVIHTVGPVWRGGDNDEDETLASAYAESMKLAQAHGLATVCFPSISTGAYGFPIDRAARVSRWAIEEALPQCPAVEEVRMVLFSAEDLAAYETAWT
jgi:O-acetyl-ADP-ribose deacetylase (regulator of RNase III)